MKWVRARGMPWAECESERLNCQPGMNEENKKESLGVRVKSAAKNLMVHITESQIVSSCVYRRRFNVRTLGVYGATGGINKAATSVGFLFGLLDDAIPFWRVECPIATNGNTVKYSRCLQFPVRSYYARKSFDFCY